MATVAEQRRANLELLVKELGTLDAVAAAGGTSSVYLSQIRKQALDTKTGRPREMGTAMARRLESATGKPEGWLDQPPPITGTASAVQAPSTAQATSSVSPDPTTPPTLDQALPVVLDALARLTPGRWGMVMSGLQPLAGHPEMRDDVLADIAPLVAAPAAGTANRTGT